MNRLNKMLKVGATLSFLLMIAHFGMAQMKPVNFIRDEAGKKVDVMIDGKLFTSYIYPEDLDKPVLYPIYTSNGTVITRGFPRDPRAGERVDHPHHVGLWFNYGDVNNLDFWNNSYAIPAEKKSEYGSIRHQRVVKTQDGTKKGMMVIQTNWVDHVGTVLMTEETTFEFSGTDDLRTIDRTTKLTAKQTVVFEESKEGMMGIRLDRAFEEPSNKPEVFTDANGNPTTVAALNNEGVNGVYRNSNGLEKGDVWGKRANWVSLSATKGDEQITIAMVDNKKNLGYPAHWHARGYGLFAINNLASKSYVPTDAEMTTTLKPGETLVFNHRVLISSGKFLGATEMNSQFDNFNK